MRLPTFAASFSQDRLLGGAIVLAVTQFAASLMGLIRDNALNRTFPGLGTVDVYIASFRPSDLLFQVIIASGLSTVLVPLLARYKAHERHEDTSALLSSVIGAGSVVFGMLALLLAIVFPWVAPKLVGFEGDELELYILFGRLALLTNFLFVCGNALGQYLITVQKYWIYGLSPILYNVGTITGTLLLVPRFGEMAPMIGTLTGGVVYMGIRLWGAFRMGFRWRARLWHPDLKKMGWLMLPRMAALGALQLELLVFDSFASGLESGAVTINANARNFQSVVVGVIGIALAQSAFPLLSNAAARGEEGRFWIYLKKGTWMLLLLTIPGAIALVLATPIAAFLVHLQHVIRVFGICLFLYALSIPFESINHLLLRSYYALHRTTTPAVFNVFNGVTAIVVSWVLLPRIGVFSLPVGFSAGQILQAAGLGAMLPRVVRRMKQSVDPIVP